MAAARRPRAITLGELRPSQIITTFGPGAVIDQPTASLMLAGTDHWSVSEDQRIDEPRLRALLRVRNLYRPRVRSDRAMRGVPAFVFPTYLVCPRCQRLATYDNFQFDGRFFRCRNRAGHREQDPVPARRERFRRALSSRALPDTSMTFRGRTTSTAAARRSATHSS